MTCNLIYTDIVHSLEILYVLNVYLNIFNEHYDILMFYICLWNNFTVNYRTSKSRTWTKTISRLRDGRGCRKARTWNAIEILSFTGSDVKPYQITHLHQCLKKYTTFWVNLVLFSVKNSITVLNVRNLVNYSELYL